jgi:hypothetical protein
MKSGELRAPNESSGGSRITLKDEIADDLDSINGRRYMWRQFQKFDQDRAPEQRQDAYCLFCQKTCDFGPEHEARARAHAMRDQTPADLREMSRDRLIEECDRLRRHVDVSVAFPMLPDVLIQKCQHLIKSWRVTATNQYKNWFLHHPDNQAFIFYSVDKPDVCKLNLIAGGTIEISFEQAFAILRDYQIPDELLDKETD